MSDRDQRPLKQRKTRGRPFLQDTQSADDDGASSASSSSSEALLPIRSQAQSLSASDIRDRDRAASIDNGNRDDSEEHEEMTSSSESEDSGDTSSEDISEEQDEEEEEEEREASQHQPRTSGYEDYPLQQSDLGSRLQDFLPQLEQANAELEQEENKQDRTIEQTSDEDEEYIVMDLSLGVLTAQSHQDVEVELPFGRGTKGQASNDEDAEPTFSTPRAAKKSTKRKIEEIET